MCTTTWKDRQKLVPGVFQLCAFFLCYFSDYNEPLLWVKQLCWVLWVLLANHGPQCDLGDTVLKHHNPTTINTLILNYDLKSKENLFLQQIAAHKDHVKHIKCGECVIYALNSPVKFIKIKLFLLIKMVIIFITVNWWRFSFMFHNIKTHNTN